MKIAIIGSNKADSMESNLLEAFEYAGHQAKIFDIKNKMPLNSVSRYTSVLDVLARRYSDSYDKILFFKLLKSVLGFNPDLVVSLYRFVHPSFVKYIKDKNIPIIQINPDQLTTLELQQIFVEPYDVYFSKDPYMVRFMRNNMKLNAYYYNEAFNSRYHHKPDIPKSECEKEVGIDVMTYGSLYPYRCRMLKYVLDAGINLKIFGLKPQRFYDTALDSAFQNRYIVGEEKAKLLYGSKIVFNQMHYAEIEGVNCRFFEANGAGAFQLSDYKPILKDILPIDPELVTFKNIDDAIEKMKYYLNNPDKRYEISSTVYEWFKDRYSYDNLIKYVLSKI